MAVDAVWIKKAVHREFGFLIICPIGIPGRLFYLGPERLQINFRAVLVLEFTSQVGDTILAFVVKSTMKDVLSRVIRIGNHHFGRVVGGLNDPRSEERRVGKECRSRWSAYD